MGEKNDRVKQRLAKLIQLANKVAKAAEEAIPFKQECVDIKSKVEKLSDLLRQAFISELYKHQTVRIFRDTKKVLNKALSLLLKKRIFIIIPISVSVSAFSKTSFKLENSIVNVSWLLRTSSLHDNNQYLGLPPITANYLISGLIWEPIAILLDSPKDSSEEAASLLSQAHDNKYLDLPPIAANYRMIGLIWEQIAILRTGSPKDSSDAAALLLSLAHESNFCKHYLIEEGGVVPILKLMKEGNTQEGKQTAARAIALFVSDIAADKHVVSFICEQISILRTDSLEDHSDAAASLVFLANVSDRYGEMIIEKGGVGPLLKLMKEGKTQEGKHNASRAISLLNSNVAADGPILSFICEQISILRTGSQEDRSDAAASLVSLAHESDRYGEMIIEEGGVGPLLKLMKEEGSHQGRENAARAICILKPINSAIILNTNATIGTQEDLSLGVTPVHFIREKRINKNNVFGKLYESNQISEIL